MLQNIFATCFMVRITKVRNCDEDVWFPVGGGESAEAETGFKKKKKICH